MTVDALYDRDTEPLYDVSDFYAKLGFDFADPNESLPPEMPYRTMYLDLKPLIDLIRCSISVIWRHSMRVKESEEHNNCRGSQDISQRLN